MTTKFKHKFSKAYLLFAVGLSALLVAVSLFWTFYPYKNLTFGDYFVNRETYKPGEFVTVTVSNFCNNGVEVQTVARKLRSNFGAIQLPGLEFYTGGDSICVKDSHFRVQIPVETIPGTYQIVFDTSYQPNPIRTITVQNYTPYFEVTD